MIRLKEKGDPLPKSEAPTVDFILRGMKPELVAWLDQKADAAKLSRNKFVVAMLERAFKRG